MWWEYLSSPPCVWPSPNCVQSNSWWFQNPGSGCTNFHEGLRSLSLTRYVQCKRILGFSSRYVYVRHLNGKHFPAVNTPWIPPDHLRGREHLAQEQHRRTWIAATAVGWEMVWQSIENVRTYSRGRWLSITRSHVCIVKSLTEQGYKVHQSKQIQGGGVRDNSTLMMAFRALALNP